MRIFLPFLLLLIAFFSCTKKEDAPDTSCDQFFILDSDTYQSAPSDDHFIQNVELEGDCLSVKFAAGGCDGESWNYDLVGVISPANLFPQIINVRLALDDQEECEALI